MQTIWSRAAQSRCLCNCPACSSITNAITRRSTTATARRRVRVGNVFTLFASSLAATATLVDSRRKDARREHWDRVIDELRTQLQATEVHQHDRLTTLSQNVKGKTIDGDETYAWRTLSMEQRRRDRWGNPLPADTEASRDTWAGVFDWAARENDIRASSGFQDWKGVPLSVLQTLTPEQIERFQKDDRLLRRFYGGPDCASLVNETLEDDLSTKKIRTLEYSVAKLVLKLLLYSSESSKISDGDRNPTNDIGLIAVGNSVLDSRNKKKDLESHERLIETPESHSPEETSITEGPVVNRDSQQNHSLDAEDTHRKISDINSRLFDLVNIPGTNDNHKIFEDFPSPTVPRYRSSGSQKIDKVRKLNRSIFQILEGMSQEQKSGPSIAKICYNLLVSDTPPNVYTYNMLLIRFCHLNEGRLVQAILNSMRESHIRPNEITHSTLLRYYTASNDRINFVNYTIKMDGYNHGLALAARDQKIPDLASHRYLFFGKDNSKAAEKARMNGEVYESIIIGALRFFGVQSAIRYYRAMIDEGWMASVEILMAILQSCYQCGDWKGGICVWKQIVGTTKGASVASYRWMLSLCRACGQQYAFQHVLRFAMEKGVIPSLTQNLADCIKHLKLRLSILDPKLPQVNGTVSALMAFLDVEDCIRRYTTDEKKMDSTKARFSPVRTVYAKSQMKALSSPREPATMCYKRMSLEEDLKTSVGNTVSVATEVSSGQQQSQVEACQSSTQESMHVLSTKVRSFNKADPLKMNSMEYKDYACRLKARLRANGQITSRTLYEKYKTALKQLENKDQDSSIVEFDSGVSRAPDSGNRANEPQSYPEILSRLLQDDRPVSTVSRPEHMPHPTSWSEMNEPSTLALRQLEA